MEGDNRLPVLADEVRQAHAAAKTALSEAEGHMADAGDRLNEAKALVGHGGWLPWLEECGIPVRTAQRYMRLARERAMLATIQPHVAALTAKYDTASYL